MKLLTLCFIFEFRPTPRACRRAFRLCVAVVGKPNVGGCKIFIMKTYDSDFQKAVSVVAEYLLQKWDVINKFDTLEEAINFSIHLGGGHSFTHPIGGFWFFEYEKGIKITLLKKGGFEYSVPKAIFLKEAEKIWIEIKHKSFQLQLFE